MIQILTAISMPVILMRRIEKNTLLPQFYSLLKKWLTVTMSMTFHEGPAFSDTHYTSLEQQSVELRQPLLPIAFAGHVEQSVASDCLSVFPLWLLNASIFDLYIWHTGRLYLYGIESQGHVWCAVTLYYSTSLSCHRQNSTTSIVLYTKVDAQCDRLAIHDCRQYSLTARRYASAVYPVIMCLSACPSIRHTPVLYENG